MRKAILFVISIAMIGGGGYLLLAHLFWATASLPKMMLAGTGLIGIGAWLLWEDFIAPLLGIQVKGSTD